jgi:Uma2 family endonuclease
MSLTTAQPTPPAQSAAGGGEWPDETKLVTEDGKPVDGIYSEKQMRLLTSPLYLHWAGDRRFIATANVGLFYNPNQPPLVPDVLLSTDVTVPDEFYSKPNRSYFVWRYGRPPKVVIEIVSNKDGGEDTTKLDLYAQIGVSNYAIHDPDNLLGGGTLRLFSLFENRYRPKPDGWLDSVGLGLTLWHGPFEEWDTIWLRWCYQKGDPIPTGAERAAEARQQAEAERQRAEKLLAILKEKGIDPGPL